MRSKAVITLILIAAMGLSSTIASATSYNFNAGTISASYGWDVWNNPFAGSFGATGVYGQSSGYSNGAFPVNTSPNGNYDLTFTFTLQGANTSVFLGLSTTPKAQNAGRTQSGWYVIGNTRNGSFRVSSTGSDVRAPLGTAVATPGQYTARIVSTDGGATTTFSISGNNYNSTPATLTNIGTPQYIIVHLNNAVIANPAFNTVPSVMSINFVSPNPSGSPTPTPTPSPSPNSTIPFTESYLQSMREFYANQPIVHMSNQSVVYYPNGTLKEVITGPVSNATASPGAVVIASPVPNATATPVPGMATATPIPSPAATRTQAPGFEIILATIGMISALVLITRKKK